MIGVIVLRVLVHAVAFVMCREWIDQGEDGINGLDGSLMVASFSSSFDIRGTNSHFGSHYSLC